MSSIDPMALHRALGRCLAEVERNPSLLAELARARREFHGVGAPDPDLLRQAAAETRFAEWYLLERDSEVLGDVPVRSLRRSMSEPPADHELIQDSIVGVFLVEIGGTVARLRDLQDDAVLEMAPPSTLELARNDLVVGRLYGDVRGHLVPSAAIAVRSAARDLARAFRSDLAALGLDRRLTQIELEHLLFRRWRLEAEAFERRAPLEHLESQLDGLLRTHGVEEPSAEEVSAALRDTEHPGSVVGPLLDRVAFDTDIDLERLRVLLLEIWNARAGAGDPAPAPPPRDRERQPKLEVEMDVGSGGLGERLARRIERGLEQHENMEEVFDDVAEMLGEDPSEEPEGVEAADGVEVAAFDGDLEPLIGEFLWEEDCGNGPEAPVLEQLVRLQKEAPVPQLELERLQSADLLRLLLQVYLEAAPARRADAVQRAFAALERFYSWAERTQEYALAAVLAECRELFVDGVERHHRASVALTAVAGPADLSSARPSLLRVVDVDARRLHVAAFDGDEVLEVTNPASLEDLRCGELVLAVLERTSALSATLRGMVLVLPAAAESMLG